MKLKNLVTATTFLVSLSITNAHASPFDLQRNWNSLMHLISGGGKGDDPVRCSGGGKGDDPVRCSGIEATMHSGGGKGDDPVPQ